MDALAAYSKINEQTQEALVKEHALLVKRIAHHLLGRLPQSVQLDDLIQAGMMGLLEAARNYDASKGASFETYAGIRIRGHMLDEVRRNDWVPRSVHRNSRKISEAVQHIENRLGREAKDVEVAQALDISITEYHEMLQDSAGSHLYGFDDLGVTDDVLHGDDDKTHTEPQKRVMHDDLMSHLSQVINSLPQKEQLVLSLYYERDLNLKEIGEVIGVSESRISQILSQAILRIRARLPD
ncbi:RNA polymerase sigma factor FliA [Legionella sp. km772]|uniref:RNA polymerase sigma factor FliA n=1 Tax=Legionella sp. km772 TaxID=2498111 RepID=UPI000F8E2031|nr:RNA polymerase sigma factor FliA [Legionella sp. km772]RUR08340.1 RNA polymerase sigma factor FliA [Legionella sp. km772]